jgi:hypothetical protein
MRGRQTGVCAKRSGEPRNRKKKDQTKNIEYKRKERSTLMGRTAVVPVATAQRRRGADTPRVLVHLLQHLAHAAVEVERRRRRRREGEAGHGRH